MGLNEVELAGNKFDGGKQKFNYLPVSAMEELNKVLMYGAEKYGDYNWVGGMSWSRMFNAACRHLFAWLGGENRDEESGLPHLAHATCCCLMLLSFSINENGEDDRPPKS